VVVVALALVWLGLKPSGGSAVPSKPAAAVATPVGSVLTDVSVGSGFNITAPANGQIVDGGLIVTDSGSAPITLLGATLLNGAAPSDLQVAHTYLLPLQSNLHDAVGIRPGIAAALDTVAPLLALSGAAAKPSDPEEVVLDLQGPSGTGPWLTSAIMLSYKLGSQVEEQTFAHNLMVCSAGESLCTDIGASTATPTPAPSGTCHTGLTSWVSGQPVRNWLATNVHSPYWVGSGGNIAFTSRSTATFSITASASVSQEEGIGFDFDDIDLSYSMDQEFGISVTKTTSYESDWAETIDVPSNAATAERLTVYVDAWSMPTTSMQTLANCDVVYSYGTVYAPDQHTTSDDYCLALDDYPGVADLGASCLSE
jgi:hypothetical protein